MAITGPTSSRAPRMAASLVEDTGLWEYRTPPPDFKFLFGTCAYLNDRESADRDDVFYFASEAKALFASGAVRATADAQGLDEVGREEPRVEPAAGRDEGPSARGSPGSRPPSPALFAGGVHGGVVVCGFWFFW